MANTPHFFKIILNDAFQLGKLGIPKKFVRRFGNYLSEKAFLKVPGGVKWQVELVKSGDAIWFGSGWQQFADYYSVSYGSFLVFGFEDFKNCTFNVSIFDKTASEINYPFNVREEHNEDSNLHEEAVLIEEDSDVEILPTRTSKDTSSLPSSIGNIIKTDVVPAVEKFQKKKERALKQKERQERLLNDFRSYGAGITRSGRSRRAITYTFDEYDRAIDEAIEISKKRKTTKKIGINNKLSNSGDMDDARDVKFAHKSVGTRWSMRLAGGPKHNREVETRNLASKNRSRQRPTRNSALETVVLDSEDDSLSDNTKRNESGCEDLSPVADSEEVSDG